MKTLICSLLFVVAAPLAAFAGHAPSPAAICIWHPGINQIHALSFQTLAVQADDGNYVVNAPFCWNLDRAHEIDLIPFVSDRVCQGDQIKTDLETCPVGQIQKQ